MAQKIIKFYYTILYMEGILKSGTGLTISKDCLGSIIEQNKRILSVREKLPPNTPTSFQTQTRISWPKNIELNFDFWYML